MSFLTDIAEFFSGSNKTHDQLNSFVNEKFTYFLNNSNLLLNFVSDFEDYKNGNIQNGKSKCDECEDLYILTSDIFEKYFNKINIPYNIDVSEGTSKTNYKDKVLYFFDLKDLKKILNEKNLDKSSSDNTQFNKKRLLCKIISLSFIKIYIIVKSIFQTFNIYNSLLNNGNMNVYKYEDEQPYNQYNYTSQPPYLAPPSETILPPISVPQETDTTENDTIENDTKENDTIDNDTIETAPLPITATTDTATTDTATTETATTETAPQGPDENTDPFEKADPIQENQTGENQTGENQIGENQMGENQMGENQTGENQTGENQMGENQMGENQTRENQIGENQIGENQVRENQVRENQVGGETMFSNIFDKLLGKKTETSPSSVTTNNVNLELSTDQNIGTSPSPEPNLREENIKLQRSNNIFYSIFVILFENSTSEQLTPANFNIKYLNKALDNITNETLAGKIPEILKYIVGSSIFSEEFLGETCLIFRDDNFKFMKLETSDVESNDATLFVDQVDEEHQTFNKIIETKRALLRTILNKENREPLSNYSNSQPRQEFANYKFFNSFKSELKTMIKNYFSSRVNLYNNIVKELFIFDKKSNSIIGLNSKLTYKYINELTKKTEIILLDLYLALFKTLNNILTNSVNEINVMKKNTSLPTTSLETSSSPITKEQYLGGAKTKTHIKRSIKRSIKRKRNKTKTRKATNKPHK